MTSLTIPNSVTSIGNYAFYDCDSLTSLTIPNSVTSIGDYAFYDCNSLISLTIGNSVTSIGDYTFYGCNSLTSLTIPNSVTSIGDYAFCDCDSLTSLTIGNSVTSIGDWAFGDCNRLISLTIPNSVTSIGDWAFYYCNSLTSLTIGNSVTSIGIAAFVGCYSLTTLTIPNSVTTIGHIAFSNCLNLTSLTIGNSVTSIGDEAFCVSYGLTEINCLSATAPTLGENVFDGGIPVNIPCGSLDSYQSEWSYYFSNFNEVFTYTIDVHSSDEAMGNSSITMMPDCDNQNTAVVEATANAGYHFDHWSDGSTENPYTVHLTGDTTLIAYFAVNTGINDMDDSGIRVYAKDHQIHIDAAVGEAVNVYTIDGRTIATLPKATEHVTIPVTTAGVFLVKIGSHPARKVVVIG